MSMIEGTIIPGNGLTQLRVQFKEPADVQGVGIFKSAAVADADTRKLGLSVGATIQFSAQFGHPNVSWTHLPVANDVDIVRQAETDNVEVVHFGR